MNWIGGRRSRSQRPREAGAALFQGLRMSLTLWYCAVMGVALTLFGIALYLGIQYSLLDPVATDTAAHAQTHKNEWLSGSLNNACPLLGSPDKPGSPPGEGFQMPEQVVCYDQNGSLLPNEKTAGLSSTFLTNTLVKTALQTGQPAYEITNAGGTVGSIYCYALVVPDGMGNGKYGVLLVGESVRAQENALSSLLKLLLGIGGGALVGAALGGLFLANRALAPARLAWTNQQRFIADASHELLTPLTLLRADAEVLLRGRGRLNAEDAALLEDIVVEANQMARFSDNLLTLARLDNTAPHREHEVLGLAELAEQGVRRIQSLAEQHGITVRFEHASTPYVIGDPMLLEQAVLILLDNAIKYNHTGGQVVVRSAVKERRALLEVQDSGIGIGAEHLDHLGERFYRVDKARSREAGGTGLGLSIARSIMNAHRGQLSLTSVLGQGTTVTLMLPLASEERPEVI